MDTPVAKPQDAVQRKKGTSVASSSAPAKAGSAGTHSMDRAAAAYLCGQYKRDVVGKNTES